MSYSYNRLVKKYMPNSSGTDLYDVDYIYGSYNDGRNGAGRIISIAQGGGFKSDSYRYDELGQRVEEDITVDVPMYGYRDFNTKKYFDSFGRILQAVYPDGDQVDYDYNSLGELNTIKSKVAGVTQDIVSAISYNGYGQISQLTYGNGTTTSYSYATGNTNKATTLMGSTVNAKEQGASGFTPVLNRTYTYNKQGMVAQMNRSVAGSLLSQVGNASFTDAYTYDRFGRLDAHAQSKGAASIYSLDMQYNQAGGITFKTSNGSGFMNAAALTYDLDYQYDPSKGHQLDFIWDPISATTTDFTYNASGSITQIDDPSQAIAQNFFWNEQQQLTGVSNQQGVHHYVYDHSGERLMKSSLINSKVYLNDQVIDDVSNLEPYTVYVNPYYVVTGLMGGDRVSKHYYMNQQRVATDITINYDPNGTGGGQQEQSLAKDPASAAPELSPALADFNEVLFGLGQKPLDTASLKLPTIESYYPEAAKTPATSSSAEGNPSAPRILFWYHPDYLGNVDLITERDGYTHEFFMYNPWGEEMHQWNANTYAFTSPYRRALRHLFAQP
jgi:YD repeat-containing protein